MTTPPDIIRSAYAEYIVTDLAASRAFYVGVLGFVVSYEDENSLYLRTFEEYLHHSIVLRVGQTPALAVLGYRVRSAAEVDAAAKYYTELGCRVERREAGAGVLL
jgi:catechol 2,3-dioxygenase